MWKIIRRVLLGLGITLLTVLVGFGLYMVWYTNRSQPTEITRRPLFEGVTYTRDVRQEPRPRVIHVVEIDLTTAGLEFLVTPKDDIPDYTYSARTVSQFTVEYDVAVAINGDFFTPWYARTPWDFYPRVGDGVNARGLTVSAGEVAAENYTSVDNIYTLFITAGNTATIGKQPPESGVYHAISGNFMLLRDGRAVPRGEVSYFTKAHPRTAVALTEDGNTLLLMVVDGRQPNYSEGATLGELASFLLEYGAHDALNLDGGGSSTLVMATDDTDRPTTLNSPIHTRLPGRQRPIANHLGVMAPPLP